MELRVLQASGPDFSTEASMHIVREDFDRDLDFEDEPTNLDTIGHFDSNTRNYKERTANFNFELVVLSSIGNKINIYAATLFQNLYISLRCQGLACHSP